MIIVYRGPLSYDIYIVYVSLFGLPWYFVHITITDLRNLTEELFGSRLKYQIFGDKHYSLGDKKEHSKFNLTN